MWICAPGSKSLRSYQTFKSKNKLHFPISKFKVPSISAASRILESPPKSCHSKIKNHTSSKNNLTVNLQCLCFFVQKIQRNFFVFSFERKTNDEQLESWKWFDVVMNKHITTSKTRNQRSERNKKQKSLYKRFTNRQNTR